MTLLDSQADPRQYTEPSIGSKLYANGKYNHDDIDRIKDYLWNTLGSWYPAPLTRTNSGYSSKNVLREDRNPGSFLFYENNRRVEDKAREGEYNFDLIELYGRIYHMTNGEAITHLKEELGQGRVSHRKSHRITQQINSAIHPTDTTPAIYPTSEAPDVVFKHPKHGKPNQIWRYEDTNGRLIGYVCRFDIHTKEGKTRKEICPLSWSKNKWTWSKEGFGQKAPIYGLERVREKPSLCALIVEGEKTADAGSRFFPDIAVLTWLGGSSNAGHADFSFLKGYDIYLWPDNDDPGRKAMEKIADNLKVIARSVRIVETFPGVPEKWDIADAEKDNIPAEYLLKHLLENSKYRQSHDTEKQKNPTFRKISITPLELARKLRKFLDNDGDHPEFELIREDLEKFHESPSLIASTLRSINHYQFMSKQDLVAALIQEGFESKEIPKKNNKSEKDNVRYSAEELLGFIESLGYKIRYNELTSTPEVTAMDEIANRSLIRNDNKDVNIWIRDEPIKNKFDSIIQEQLAALKDGKGGSGDSKRYFRAIEHAPAYHPFVEYIEDTLSKNYSNEIDSSHDYMEELANHIDFKDVSDKIFFKKALRLWMINHISRIMRKNQKNVGDRKNRSSLQNPVLVFLGYTQGKGKSTLVEMLCPPSLRDKYFNSVDHLNPENKDHKKLVSESFMIEIPEVVGTTAKVEFNRLKSYLTMPYDVFRSAYERREEKRARLCSFIGTSNDPVFLTDPTGNRRWWVSKVEGVDLEWITEEFNSDALWAHAIAEARLMDYSPVWPKEFIDEAAYRATQATFQDPITDLIKQFEYSEGSRVTNKQLKNVLIGEGISNLQAGLNKLRADLIRQWPNLKPFNTGGDRGLTNLKFVPGHVQANLS